MDVQHSVRPPGNQPQLSLAVFSCHGCGCWRLLLQRGPARPTGTAFRVNGGHNSGLNMAPSPGLLRFPGSCPWRIGSRCNVHRLCTACGFFLKSRQSLVLRPCCGAAQGRGEERRGALVREAAPGREVPFSLFLFGLFLRGGG